MNFQMKNIEQVGPKMKKNYVFLANNGRVKTINYDDDKGKMLILLIKRVYIF